MQYDNTNRGTLFKNDRKEKDTHPDLKGSINIDGKEYWLSGWSKVTSKGDKMLSLSVTPKEQEKPKSAGKPAYEKPKAELDEFDESLPF